MIPVAASRFEAPSDGTATVVLTGATGMVGCTLTAEALRRGHRVIALVRPGDVGPGSKGDSLSSEELWSRQAHSASQRLEKLLRPFREAWQTDFVAPEVVPFDLHRDDTKWLKDVAWRLQGGSPAVMVHSAASLDFRPTAEQSDNEPYRTNVDGTSRLIRMIRKLPLAHYFHVSTAYVCGQRRGRIGEADLDHGQTFSNDYERSKLIAETHVREVFGDQSATVFRPSIVVDPSGLAPVSGDRTIYGAFSMYQLLASRFGLPQPNEWMRQLGFEPEHRKNLVDVRWVVDTMLAVIRTESLWGKTYHLTAPRGTSVATMDRTFREVAAETLKRRKRRGSRSSQPRRTAASEDANGRSTDLRASMDQLTLPFVQTFAPYFRDDPIFDRTAVEAALANGVRRGADVGVDDLRSMISPKKRGAVSATNGPLRPAADENASVSTHQTRAYPEWATESCFDGDPIVICGYAVRLPGGIDDAKDYWRLLASGESAIEKMPAERLDRELYFDSRVGRPGFTYTELGGCVDPKPLDAELVRKIERLGNFDLTHRQFASVAVAAMRHGGLLRQTQPGVRRESVVPSVDPKRIGMFVGHSGGTQSGGPLAMSVLAEAAVEPWIIDAVDEALGFRQLLRDHAQRISAEVVAGLRQDRVRVQDHWRLEAYQAASLAAQLTGIQGRREVVDAACSSSLVALLHAGLAIRSGRLDAAVVGGATFNNVDNLALFSQSGACSASGCRPFDDRASGLISSEGYTAVVITRRSIAMASGLPIHGIVRGVGMSSDGKGKGLWAPRTEGQQLAIRRGDPDPPTGEGVAAEGEVSRPVDVDYFECHATSTQVGDATELETLRALLQTPDAGGDPDRVVPIGSAKSNLGHLLEAAGLAGVVKTLLAMRHDRLPPSVGFENPTTRYRWDDGPIAVVDQVCPWPSSGRPYRTAGVNAFGIGGLNGHVRLSGGPPSSSSSGASKGSGASKSRGSSDRCGSSVSASDVHRQPLAIVAAGLVVPGVTSLETFAKDLASGSSHIGDPPPGRWPTDGVGRPIGVLGGGGNDPVLMRVPHHLGGYVRDFAFDAQSYRIPPKMVAQANPAGLMLIDAVTQAVSDFAPKFEGIDRTRVGVTVGTIFGGEFSNALQIGLRIPEIAARLRKALLACGVPENDVQNILTRYRKGTLSRFGSLLDETGGFTASTQASAIARVFDLMGGAAAVDADQASGGLAMLASAERLWAGEIDLAICGATHRSNDLVSLRQLHLRNQLASEQDLTQGPLDGSRIFPGEGAVCVMLCRLDDALRKGHPVIGVLDGLSESFEANVVQSRRQSYDQSRRQDRTCNGDLDRRYGHLGGAQGLLRTIVATVEGSSADGSAKTVSWTDQFEELADAWKLSDPLDASKPGSGSVSQSAIGCRTVKEVADDGYSISWNVWTRAHSKVAERSVGDLVRDTPNDQASDESDQAPQHDSSTRLTPSLDYEAPRHEAVRHAATGHEPFRTIPPAAAPPRLTSSVRYSQHSDSESPKDCFRISASNPRDLGNVLQRLASADGVDIRSFGPSVEVGDQFIADRPFRAAVLCDGDRQRWAKHLLSALQTCGERNAGKGPGSLALACTGGWVHGPGVGRRTGWLFPGQGSQYAERPRILHENFASDVPELIEAARQAERQLAEFDETIVIRGCRPIGPRLHDPERTLGRDLWWTQAWVLGVGMAMTRATHCLTGKPDLMLGHSFGECTAAWAAGAMGDGTTGTLAAIDFARFRSEAVAMLPTSDLRLLSARASLGSVRAAIGNDLPFEITHFNAPEQTVLAVSQSSLAAIQSRLQSQRIASAAIEVPAAYHTEAMRPAQEMLAARWETTSVRFPSTPLLSATQCRYLSEPKEIFANLVNQLTMPVHFAAAVQRGVEDGIGLWIEVGPGNVLTKLADQSSNASALCLGFDDPNRSIESTWTLLAAAQESLTGNARPSRGAVQPHVPAMSASSAPSASASISNGSVAAPAAAEGSATQAATVPEFAQASAASVSHATPANGQASADPTASRFSVVDVRKTSDRTMAPALISSAADRGVSVADRSASGFHDRPNVAAEVVDDEVSSRAEATDVGDLSSSLERMIIDLVVDQTGYDEEIIDMEADLEGELGVDSIKRAQLLGELETQYDLSSLRDQNLRLSDFPTLGSIHAYVLEHLKKKAVLN